MHEKSPPRAILITGPTASGKSALALRVAERLGGVLVNADSMQVYRDLRVLTARPTEEDERRVPHLLFGHIDGAENYSVGRWLKDFGATLDALDRPAILTGGTGMYFKATLQGLSDIPSVPDDVRAAVRARAEGKTPQELHAELREVDPETASRLRNTDPQRILRALEIYEATGATLASFQGSRAAPLLDAAHTPAFFLAPERPALFARIDTRFDRMIETGALNEVRALAARRLDPALPVMRAHGVPHLLAYLDGRLSFEEAIARGKAYTRHYAKRQFPFARHQLPTFEWLAGENAERELFARLETAT